MYRTSSLLNAVLTTWIMTTAPISAQVMVGGDDRPAEVHVPSSYDPDVPMPLILLLHGFGGGNANGQGVENKFRFLDFADAEGFLYIHPDGTPNPCGNRFWNAFDYCCANFCGAAQVDDSGYLRRLIEETSAQLNVDSTRIYVAGFSAGGDMAHRMGCDHGDLLAGVVSLSGATSTDPSVCAAQAPLHVLQVHGTADAYFDGGTFAGVRLPSALETVETWAARNGCRNEPEAIGRADFVPPEGDETQMLRFSAGCSEAGSAELWAVEGGGHGVSSPQLTLAMIRWMLAHPKRSAPQAVLTADVKTGFAPLTVSFDAAGSTVPDDTALALAHWAFGDGATARGLTVQHTFDGPGRYVASLRVVTADGRVSLMTREPIIVQCSSGEISPWSLATVGTTRFPHAATLQPAGALRLCVGGGIVGREDETAFVYQEIAGDFELTARVAEVHGGSGLPFDVGVMLRAGLDANAPMAATVLGATGGQHRFRLRRRMTTGDLARTRSARVDTPLVWVRIEREGGIVRGLGSVDGITWSTIDEREFSADNLPETVFAGVAAWAADVETLVPTPYQPLRALVTDISLHGSASRFLRGDCNDDGEVDISDAVCTLNWLFLGGPLRCVAAANANGDDAVNITDAIHLLDFLFLGGSAPVEPFPGCGVGALATDEESCMTPPKNCPP